MNGKGDKRRPLSVSEEVFAENWSRIFGRTGPAKTPTVVPGLEDALIRDYTAAQDGWKIPTIEDVLKESPRL